MTSSKNKRKANKAAKLANGVGEAANGSAEGSASSPVSPSDTIVEEASSSSLPKSPEDPIVAELPVEEQKPPEPVDPAVEGERLKEQGNTSFKAKRYGEAVDLYTEAIALRPQEPSYLTNRAAAYIALKRFRSALDDCQKASTQTSTAPQPKILVRLARCQLALGQSNAALSTLRAALDAEPGNTAAQQLRDKARDLEAHLRNVESARERRNWPMARLALDRCFSSVEGEGSEIPTEWRIWRVELELARGNLDAANAAANDTLRLQSNSPDALALRGLVLFLSGKLPQATQHVQSALRFDPGHEPAQKLRRRVKDVERLKEEGNTAFKTARLSDAVEKYSEAIDRIGDKEEEAGGGLIRATLLSNRATTLVKLNRHEEALSDCDIALELQPTSFKAFRTRARINLHLERYESAVADFKSSLERAESESADADARALRADLKKAEAALKRSKTKDYYKILGLARDCNETDIKKAYRRESLKHHPDKGGDEEKFKLVVEAHAVLSDPQRRERYDLGEDEDGQMGSGGGTGPGGMSQEDIANIFATFGGGGFGGGGFGGGGGGFGGGGFGGRPGGYHFSSGGGGGGFHGF